MNKILLHVTMVSYQILPRETIIRLFVTLSCNFTTLCIHKHNTARMKYYWLTLNLILDQLHFNSVNSYSIFVNQSPFQILTYCQWVEQLYWFLFDYLLGFVIGNRLVQSYYIIHNVKKRPSNHLYIHCTSSPKL